MMLFAVTDIETTGSNAEGNKIIEIGIVISDGTNIIDRFETLVNPERTIDKYIQGLTGITPAMLTTAPVWEDVAEKVYHLLHDKIFVAHNVQFDYSFIQYHLKKLGFKWQAPKVDTIKLTRHYFKNIHKYGLSTLIDHFSIEVPSRHRAFGDAIAAHFLLNQAIVKGGMDYVVKQAHKNYKHHNLSPYIDSVSFEMLPENAGVYYFLDSKRKIVYIGKAKNIKKRVLSHFYSDVNKEKKQLLIKEVKHIDYTICLNELHASLLESAEIKKYWPKWNKAQKFGESNLGMYVYPTVNGAERIIVTKQKPSLQAIITHPSRKVLLAWLHQAATISKACYCVTGSGNEKQCDKSKCAFKDNISTEEKRKRIQQVVSLVSNQPSFIIHHFKKNIGYLYIYVKKGSLQGWKLTDKHTRPYLEEAVANIIEPIKENAYIRRLIAKHIHDEPKKIYWIKEKKQKNK
jgi:DNA polymerase III subunit epsilon